MWRQHDRKMAGADRRQKIFTPSTRKYVSFYRGKMPTLSRAFTPRGPPRSFADIGASPGGMCEYLVRDLDWHGHAFSLSEADGGFGMAFAHKKLVYTDADLSAEGAWRLLLREVPSAFFVNAGIVVDRGQKKAQGGGDTDEEGFEGWARTVRSLEFGIILRNELLFALRALCEGGHLYFAYQLGIYSMLFKLLLALRPAFGSVRVTSTFAAHRTPIYVFLGEYAGAESSVALEALSFLEALPTTGADAFAPWHVSSWDASVTALHAELADDLHEVWRTQERHLRQQREQAERMYRARDGAGPPEAPRM
jgi:hypothetical protein